MHSVQNGFAVLSVELDDPVDALTPPRLRVFNGDSAKCCHIPTHISAILRNNIHNRRSRSTVAPGLSRSDGNDRPVLCITEPKRVRMVISTLSGRCQPESPITKHTPPRRDAISASGLRMALFSTEPMISLVTLPSIGSSKGNQPGLRPLTGVAAAGPTRATRQSRIANGSCGAIVPSQR
jgi:hypothetical protein